VDAAVPQSATTVFDEVAIDEFFRESHADSYAIGKEELATVLIAIGARYNYGLPAGISVTRAQKSAFWHSLQLPDLALAHACALGREVAWQQFIARFREPLTRAAISITGSASRGHELADSLYADLFGLTERGRQRTSPLAYYSGRGSLLGFLRTTLAQRNVDRHRQTMRETQLPDRDFPAATAAAAVAPAMVSHLETAVTTVIGTLAPEERFLLSSWFLDRRTLLDIAAVLKVHEATVSRRIHRLTARLHNDLLKHLQLSGMSRAAGEEALGTDPRDIDINLRRFLQGAAPSSFPEQEQI